MSTAVAPLKQKRPVEFDDALLMSMAEPLTVHLERQVGGKSMPVTHLLPIKTGESTQGTGWSQEDVKNLPTWMIQNVEAGSYKVTVVDKDGGKKMSWAPYFPTTLVSPAGEVVPPPPVVAGTAPAQQQPAVPPVAAAPVAAPIFHHPGVTTVPPTPWTSPAFQSPYAGGGIPGVPGGYVGQLPANPLQFMQQMPAPAPVPLRTVSETDQLQKEREERIKLEARIERERLDASHREQINGVRVEMRQLVDGIRTSGQETGSTVQMREQLAAAQRQNEQQQFMAAMERQRQDTLMMIQAMREASDKQIAAVQQQIAALVTTIAQKPTGPDPIMLMIEAQKAAQAQQLQMFQMQMQQQQHQAQMQAEATKTQMGPREWIELARSSNQTGEQLAAAYAKVQELMMNSVEVILQAQGPQMHPALQMLGEGVQGALGLGQKYMETREQAIQASAAVGQQAANANMALANQLALTRQAAAQQQIAGAAAPTDEPDDEDDDDQEDEADQADDAPRSSNVIAQGSISVEAQAERRKWEKAQFGPAYEDIRRLRTGVRTGQLDAAKAAVAITQGVTVAAERGMLDQIPIFGLWREGRLAELIDALLPEGTMPFRQAIVEVIVMMRDQQQHKMAEAQTRAAGSQPPAPKKPRKPMPAPAAS